MISSEEGRGLVELLLYSSQCSNLKYPGRVLNENGPYSPFCLFCFILYLQGGAFGGKDGRNRPLSCAAAVAAHK